MPRISDPVLAEILSEASIGGHTKSAAKAIFATAILLLACRSLNDISIFASIQKVGGRCSVVVDDDWTITFSMSAGIGPHRLKLEKASKEWPKSAKKSSHPKSRGKS